MNIIDKIKTIPDLCHLSGCNMLQIKTAQKTLGLVFPAEYVDYVKHYGAISFHGTEWTGLNVEGYLNVVNATTAERKLCKDFPKDCFVLENQAIDGWLTIVKTNGKVYSYQGGNPPKFISRTIGEYLEKCIKENR